MSEKSALLRAAMAGLIGVAVVSARADEKADKKGKENVLKQEVVKCYGVNKCSGHGSCSGAGHECGGKNGCKGKGWLYMPKESCESLEGGSLAPLPEEAPKAAPEKKEAAPEKKQAAPEKK